MIESIFLERYYFMSQAPVPYFNGSNTRTTKHLGLIGSNTKTLTITAVLSFTYLHTATELPLGGTYVAVCLVV